MEPKGRKKPAEESDFWASSIDLRQSGGVFDSQKSPRDYIRASACDIGLIWQEPWPTQKAVGPLGSRQ